MDFSLLERKPFKQRRRNEQHSAVTPVKSGFTCEGEANHDVLRDLLGQSPSKLRPLNAKIQCFEALHSRLQNKERMSSMDNLQWKQVHGFVVLHLGNALNTETTDGDSQNTSNSPSDKFLETLCLCLLEIYQSTIAQDIFSKEELQIVFSLVVQHATNLNLNSSNQNGSDKTQQSRQDICSYSGLASILLDVSRILLSQHTPKLETVESLNIFLARLLFHGSNDLDNSIHQNAHSLLRELAYKQNEQIAKRASWAIAAIAAVEQKTHINRTDHSGSAADHLMFWRCLAQSKEGATRLSRATNVLDQLVNMAVSPKDMASAKCSVDCLSQIAIHRSNPTPNAASSANGGPDSTQQALLQVLVSSDDHSIREGTIAGLMQCNAQNLPWQDARLIHSILTPLLALATAKRSFSQMVDCKIRIGAATILLEVIENILFQYHHQRPPLVQITYSEAIRYIGFLLCEEYPPVLHMATQALYQEVQRNGTVVAFQASEVLSQLAAVSCSSLASMLLKLKTVEILEIITRSEDALSLLVRQKKILEAVVFLASSASLEQVDSDAYRTLKNLALTVLIRLSKDACNRRILAKQVGVISCMIRYARDLSDRPIQWRQQQGEQAVCLTDLKQKIMDLAIAL